MRLSCLNRKNRGAVKTLLAIREVGPATVRHTCREETRSRGEGSHSHREENSGNTRGSAPHREGVGRSNAPPWGRSNGAARCPPIQEATQGSYSPEAEDTAEVGLAANSEEVVGGSDVAAIRAAISRSMSTSCSGEKREGSSVAPASALLPAAAPGSASDPVAIAREVARKKFELENPADCSSMPLALLCI